MLTNQYQTWPQIEPEHLELLALEFGKNSESDFVYTRASTNINQSALNLVKMYVTIRSRMRWITDLIGPQLSELFALEFAKIAESDFVYTLIVYKSVADLEGLRVVWTNLLLKFPDFLGGWGGVRM